ncbi:TraE/TraK family type IV conjugative transfer system protein [Neisseria sp. CCUG12390]|uniref:TraE/TraK family type IV conjugative transfer system protein n=1 Tax=Neisseria sp. CCUG12390 TaxID=3392035 RepID=UPI003A0FE0B0
MQWPTFKMKFRDSLQTNTILGMVSLGLLAVVVLQQIKINGDRERIALKPPHALSQEVMIGWDSASQNYLNSFALYIVGTMSSATPQTVDHIANVMEPLFDRQPWQLLKPQLMAIKNNPNYIGINPVSNFTPTADLIYEPKTGKIFIPGKLVSSAYSKGGMTQLGAVDLTYEIVMHVVDGIPKVKHWYVYPGEPHTLKWAERYPEKAEKEEADRKAQIQILPTVPDSEIRFPTEQASTTEKVEKAEPASKPETQPSGQSTAQPTPDNASGGIPGVVMPPADTAPSVNPAASPASEPSGQSQADLL